MKRVRQHKYPICEMPVVMSYVARLSPSLWRSWPFRGQTVLDARSARPRSVSVWPSAIAVFAPLVACAAPAGPQPQYPRSETICQYVGLESVETPQQSNIDSLSFVAVYRFREPHEPAPEQPLQVKFQVNRSRVAELQSHLESQPEVVCTPDHNRHYSPRVKPLPEPPQPPPAPLAPGSVAAPSPPQAAPATPEPAPALGPKAN